MAKTHTVIPGECLSSIAFQYGFFEDTLWNDPANAELKKLRVSMNVLKPGDKVSIPDKRVKEETRPTGASHRFQRRGVPAKLNLQILDQDKVMANQPYTLKIDQNPPKTGTTDAEGKISVSISPIAKKALLTVGQGEAQREYALSLGHLLPIDTLDGVQSRLSNLGFDCMAENGTFGPLTEAAIRDFQAKNGLSVTGELTDETRNKIKQVHDER